MTRTELNNYIDSQLIDNQTGQINPVVHRTVLKTVVENAILFDELPFDIKKVQIQDADLTSLAYDFVHELNCPDPLFLVNWINGKPVRGDGYFDITRNSNDSHKFTFFENIPTGTVTIYALKFMS